MISALVQIFRAIGLLASVLIALMACEVQAHTANVNDIARLLAGMQPSPDSPLLAMTRDRAWQQHANRLKRDICKGREPPAHPNQGLVAGEAYVAKPGSFLHVQWAGLSIR